MENQMHSHRSHLSAVAALLALSVAATSYAVDEVAAPPTASQNSTTEVSSELNALKTRIAELEKKQNEDWLTEERAKQIKTIVRDVIADSRSRGQFGDGDAF